MTSVSAELAALVGIESTASERPEAHNWRELCVCGHLDRYHSESVGGMAERPGPGGLPLDVPYVFHGCNGELPPRGTIRRVPERQDNGPTLVREMATCPCEEFRAVARVDRP